MASVKFIQGDTISEVITIYQPDGVTLIGDISGGTVKFRIVKKLSDVAANALFTDDAVTISDGPNSEATLSIARSVTKLWTPDTYFWEVEYIDAAGDYQHTYHDICIIEGSIYAAD